MAVINMASSKYLFRFDMVFCEIVNIDQGLQATLALLVSANDART